MVSLGVVLSLLLAKHSEVEKFKSIRHYYKRYRTHYEIFSNESLRMFLNQTTDAQIHESEILRKVDDKIACQSSLIECKRILLGSMTQIEEYCQLSFISRLMRRCWFVLMNHLEVSQKQ